MTEGGPTVLMSPYEPLTFSSLLPRTVVEMENPVPQSPRLAAVSEVPPSPPERDRVACVSVKTRGLAAERLSSRRRPIGRVAGDERSTHFQSSAMALVGMM